MRQKRIEFSCEQVDLTRLLKFGWLEEHRNNAVCVLGPIAPARCDVRVYKHVGRTYAVIERPAGQIEFFHALSVHSDGETLELQSKTLQQWRFL